MRQHTDTQYAGELVELKDMILKMGALVEEMIRSVIHMLFDSNADLIKKIRDHEDIVNKYEMEIDDHCFKIIALRQPIARDLRFSILGFKISKDLERAGDLAMNLMRDTADVKKYPPIKMGEEFQKMADMSLSMMKRSLDSFAEASPEVARKVCQDDDELDLMHKELKKKTIALMKEDAQYIEPAVFFISIINNLERLGDQATNIAEEVIFMVEAKDIRHGSDH
jgi:phosphate transport system protein